MKYLLEHEQRQLLKILRDSKRARRDYMIIDLILHTGLRLQELRLLNLGDVYDGMTIRSHLVVRPETAKRCKEREIFLNSHIRKHLRIFTTWKRSRGESMEPTSALFISKKSGRVAQRTVQEMITKWYCQAGLLTASGKAKYTVHSLRHTFSMNLRRRGVSLERIQKLLGHTSLQATGIYLEPSREDLMEAIEQLAS